MLDCSLEFRIIVSIFILILHATSLEIHLIFCAVVVYPL